jgi:hypothetical protein
LARENLNIQRTNLLKCHSVHHKSIRTAFELNLCLSIEMQPTNRLRYEKIQDEALKHSRRCKLFEELLVFWIFDREVLTRRNDHQSKIVANLQNKPLVTKTDCKEQEG